DGKFVRRVADRSAPLVRNMHAVNAEMRSHLRQSKAGDESRRLVPPSLAIRYPRGIRSEQDLIAVPPVERAVAAYPNPRFHGASVGYARSRLRLHRLNDVVKIRE